MKRSLYILCVTLSLITYGQNEDIDLERFAERLFQLQDQDIAYEDIYESLLLFYTNKLNLTTVEPEELASLYILNPAQLSSFFNYRDQFGNFLSMNELQAIPSFNLETIRLLLPFVTVKDSFIDNRAFIKRLIEEENNYLLLRYSQRLEDQVGFTAALPLDSTFIRDKNNSIIDTALTVPSRFRGSPAKIYGRFRTSRRGDFSVGFTFEKDQGESFVFNRTQAGFDFYSYHFLLEDKLGFDKIMLGDFQLQVGQGVVFGAGFNAGKGAETVTAAGRAGLGLRPYTSVLESGFFRGIGMTKSMGGWEATTFFSSIKQDGIIRSDTTFSEFEEFANSIQRSGFHRTSSEISNKNRIIEHSIGGSLQYSPNRRFKLGMTALYSQYSVPLRQTPTSYNHFEFKGNQNYVTSLYGNYTWQNFSFFGEAARSKSGGIGAIGGFMASLSRTVDMAMLVRNYDRHFHSFYGNAFSENTRNINESGVYWGVSLTPNRKHKLNAYYDSFRFPWLKYRTEAPSAGNEWLIRYTNTPNRAVSFYAQIRQQIRQVTVPNENLNVLVDQVKYNYLFNVNYQVMPWLALKTKIQSSTQQQGEIATKGFAILQDVNFSIWRLKFHTRVALFETDDFANAQYVYENDVLYAFSLPAYNGSGVRTYAMVRYDPIRTISLWLRYSQFSFRDRSTIGSGLSRSDGDTSSEVKVMARVTF